MSEHYGRAPATETPDGTYIHGYPKVFPPQKTPDLLRGDGTIVIEEKLDGGQYRVRLGPDGDRVYGSKKTVLGCTPETFNTFFQRPATYIEREINAAEQTAIVDEYGPITVFGENMLRHALDYDWESVPPFLAFDVYRHDTSQYVDIETARDITNRLGLSFVPILDTFSVETFNPAAYAASLPDSEFRDGHPEGVVVKNYETQTFAKLVHEDYHEVHHAKWGFAPKYADDLAEIIVARYVTNERIEKELRKLVLERGEGSLSMALTEDLYHRVYDDVWAENWEDVVRPKNRTDLPDDGQVLDFRKLQNLVMKRCRTRLETVVDNHELIRDELAVDDLDDAEYLEFLAIGATQDT